MELWTFQRDLFDEGCQSQGLRWGWRAGQTFGRCSPRCMVRSRCAFAPPSECEFQAELEPPRIARALDHIPVGYVRRRGRCAKHSRIGEGSAVTAGCRELRSVGHVVHVELEFTSHALRDPYLLAHRKVP